MRLESALPKVRDHYGQYGVTDFQCAIRACYLYVPVLVLNRRSFR